MKKGFLQRQHEFLQEQHPDCYVYVLGSRKRFVSRVIPKRLRDEAKGELAFDDVVWFNMWSDYHSLDKSTDTLNK